MPAALFDLGALATLPDFNDFCDFAVLAVLVVVTDKVANAEVKWVVETEKEVEKEKL